jgi:peptidoglycan/xylan/chitin deacetylase (PgdA/CDA1 family)
LDVLGTARVLSVDAVTTPRVGRKSFPETLPLAPKEIVLTFDDGPWAGTTSRILDALRNECVRATFFLLGRNAAAHGDLARREIAEGHTVGNHSFSHPLLGRMPLDAAKAEIDRGFATIDSALYGKLGDGTPTTPFFRFPGFVSSALLLDYL